jgi:hypothetical protein
MQNIQNKYVEFNSQIYTTFIGRHNDANCWDCRTMPPVGVRVRLLVAGRSHGQ